MLKRLITFALLAAAFAAHAQCVVGPDAGTYPCTVDVPAQTITVPAQSIAVPGQTIQLQVTVKAPAVVFTPPVVQAAPVVTPPTVPAITPLAPISGTVTRILSSGGSITSVPDPGGSGTQVNLHTITKAGSSIVGGVRAELAWTGTQLKPGTDYWMAFAVQVKAGITSTSSYDDLLVMQTHSPAQGDTQPDISLHVSGQAGSRWYVAYNTKASNTWAYVGGSNKDTEGVAPFGKEANLPAGKWVRYVVHYRPGFQTSHAPRTRVWRAFAGGDFAQLFDSTGFNTYNSLVGPSYPRIGLYKWTDSVWTATTVSAYLTPLYLGQGDDLLEAGKAAVAAFK